MKARTVCLQFPRREITLKKINYTPENKIWLLKCTSGINGVLQMRQFTAWVSNEGTQPGVKAEGESNPGEMWGSFLPAPLVPHPFHPSDPLFIAAC